MSDTMVLDIACFVRGVLAPLTLVLSVLASAAVTPLDVFVQVILSQTLEVAVDTTQHGATCERRF